MSTAQIAGQPRYAQVAQALIEDIQAGRYPVGTLLPTEQELCRQFDISRHTVREAMVHGSPTCRRLGGPLGGDPAPMITQTCVTQRALLSNLRAEQRTGGQTREATLSGSSSSRRWTRRASRPQLSAATRTCRTCRTCGDAAGDAVVVRRACSLTRRQLK